MTGQGLSASKDLASAMPMTWPALSSNQTRSWRPDVDQHISSQEVPTHGLHTAEILRYVISYA